MAKKKQSKKTPRRSAEKRELISLPPPFPLAMVVCDRIHRDPGTGKLFILGCFSIIGVETLPATHLEMGLYVELTNGRGKIPIRVRLVDADEERDPIWETTDDFESEDPRTVMQLAFDIRGLQFEHAGEYRFQLFACSEFLMERRIIVLTQKQLTEES